MKGERYKRELEGLKTRLRIKELELSLYRHTERLYNKGFHIDRICGLLMDGIKEAIHTEDIFIHLKDPVRGTEAGSLVSGRFRKEEFLKKAILLTEKTIEEGGPLYKEEQAMLVLPVKVKGSGCGAIGVVVEGDRREAQKILRGIAGQLASLIERKSMFDTLEEKVAQLSALHEVGSLLVSTLDEKTVRERAISSITRLIGAEAGSLLLVDKERRELYFEVALGEKGDRVKTIRLKLGEGIAGWVAKHGKAIIVNDVTGDDRFQSRVDRHSRFRTRSIICVPVRIKNDIIGVLEGINRIDGEFTEKDLSILELFSNQVAIALDNARLYKEIRDTFYATSEALADAIEKRDPYTGGHTKRVFQYSMAIAEELGLDDKTKEDVRFAAVLHDVGKIGIDDCILRKQDRLNREEQDIMETHPQLGAEILSHIPHLKDVVPGILYHHERVDGNGYPEGLEEEDIPVIARIISVADTYDAMTTTRPYRKALSREAALRELRRCADTQFDRTVVNAFVRAFKKRRCR